MDAFYYQLFVEKDERLSLPSVQQLFEQSFLQSDIKLKEVPSCLIIQMPRFGKNYKMYPRILPSQVLDVTDIIEDCKFYDLMSRLHGLLVFYFVQRLDNVLSVESWPSMSVGSALACCNVVLAWKVRHSVRNVSRQHTHTRKGKRFFFCHLDQSSNFTFNKYQ